MKPQRGKLFYLLAMAIVAAGLIPLLLARAFFAGATELPVSAARQMLDNTNDRPVLVDVRPPPDYASNHLAGALNWPYARIAGLRTTNEIPAGLQGRLLLLVCDSGLCSALAAKKLGRFHGPGALSVAGGMEAWKTQVPDSGTAAPIRQMSALEQWLPVITGFGVKPAYMALSLGIIVVLWRQTRSDLTALRWGMIWFLAGEAACAANYLFCGSGSNLVEYLHSYGMTVGFAFITFALLDGVDHRLIKFSSATERCAALGLCGACGKYQEVACGLQRLFGVIIPAFLALAAMPLCASLKGVSYNAGILGYVYNYSHPVLYQIYETRYCPILAMACFAASWGVLLFKKQNPVTPSKMLFAAGCGSLGFGLMRLFLFSAYSDNLVWFEVWEELTELMFVVCILLVLWIFRQRLFDSHHPAATTST